MKVMTSEELEREFDITEEQLDSWEKDAAAGILHGEPRGEVIAGRPLLFGEEMRQVGFKEPLRKVDAINRRADDLGMTRSDYLRYLVDEDLKRAESA